MTSCQGNSPGAGDRHEALMSKHAVGSALAILHNSSVLLIQLTNNSGNLITDTSIESLHDAMTTYNPNSTLH